MGGLQHRRATGCFPGPSTICTVVLLPSLRPLLLPGALLFFAHTCGLLAKLKFRPLLRVEHSRLPNTNPLSPPTGRGGEHLRQGTSLLLTSAGGRVICLLVPASSCGRGFSWHLPLRLRRFTEIESGHLLQGLARKPRSEICGWCGCVRIHPCPSAAS